MAVELRHQDLVGILPSRQQLLVLRAALSEPEIALSAFAEWRTGVDDAKEFDREIFRLLPLLYHNMQKCGCTDPLMTRLKGVYRMNWVKTHTLFERMRPLVHAFADAGFDVMLLKGAPLGVRHYGNPALRPMMDIDIAIPERDAKRAIAMIKQSGWRANTEPSDDIIRFRHSGLFYGPDNEELDLHWRSLAEFVDAETDDEFRDRTTTFEFLDRKLLAPDATRLLLHTIIHGIRWNPEPPVRWIADSMAIFNSASADIRWHEMLDFAERRQLTHRLGIGLKYLKHAFAAPVPDSVIEAIDGHRQTRVERFEAKTILVDEYELYGRALGPLMIPAGEFARYVEPRRPLRSAFNFGRFLRYFWKLEKRREIPSYIMRGVRSRIARVIHAQ